MNQIHDWLCSDGNNPCEARRFTTDLQETTRPSLGKSVYSTLPWDSLRFSIGRGQTTNTDNSISRNRLPQSSPMSRHHQHGRRRARQTSADHREQKFRSAWRLTLKETAPVKPVTLLTLMV